MEFVNVNDVNPGVAIILLIFIMFSFGIILKKIME